MSLDWKFCETKQLEYGKPPSAWIAVAIITLVGVAGFGLAVLTWQKSQPVVSVSFFARALLAPLLGSGLLCVCVYAGHEDHTGAVDIWNFLCRRRRARWRAWSQGCVAMLESVTLTPEKDLAERMLGLEGSEPRNEGKMLALSTGRQSATGEAADDVLLSGTRLEAVLEMLVAPFVPCMVRFGTRHTFTVILQSEDEDGIKALRAVLRRLEVPNADRIGIDQAGCPPDASLVHQWLNDRAMPEFCLVLACQLHKRDQEPRYSEAAVGVLFVREGIISQYKGELRAKAYVFQPVSSAADSVADALRGMINAQQISPDRLRHLWLTSMPRQGVHAAVAAASDAGLKVAVHNIDQAIGKHGPASALLAQALAAEMVQHGQGMQIVATSGGTGIVLNVTGTKRAAAPAEPEFGLRYFRPLTTLGIACMCGLLGIFLDVTIAPAGLYATVPALFIILMTNEALGAQGRYNEVEDVFYGRSS